jgi:glucuronate isomerase
MPFIHEDFLLRTKTACRLYHEFAEDQPILDYHTHLPPAEMAANSRFGDLAKVWLGGDHYKWRAMRTNGVTERFCTGDAEPYEKFLAWARTVPQTLRNPLYHWTHMELKRYFGIDDLLNEKTAPKIWERANAMLATDELTPKGIFQKFKVRAVCTTDDPCDDLAAHQKIAKGDLGTKVYPTFRPDRVLEVDLTEQFNGWVDKLSVASKISISKFADPRSNSDTTFSTNRVVDFPTTASMNAMPTFATKRRLRRSLIKRGAASKFRPTSSGSLRPT